MVTHGNLWHHLKTFDVICYSEAKKKLDNRVLMMFWAFLFKTKYQIYGLCEQCLFLYGQLKC